MAVTTRVDLHCHSIYSDGTLTPREIADALGAANVAAAALADHDSIDGLAEFSSALAQREIGYIPGVEITVQYQEQEAHLLAYGFDPTHPELRSTLLSLRQARPSGVQSVAETLRRKGAAVPAQACPAAQDGKLGLVEAIALVHRAGGKAFLAHPLILQPDFAKLERLLSHLKTQGLDGLEAIYPAFSEAQRSRLCALAKQLGLLVSAGRDTHDYQTSLGMAMPTPLWKEFRDAVCTGPAFSSRKASRSTAGRSRPSLHWRSFLFHFLFPTLLAIALFVNAIYAILLPAFERSLLDRKREMIQQLTNSAWSILASYERDERAGRLTREQAQSLAISRIASLRYGPENKDYFWLQDFHPRIIMHPYRRDLNGQDVSQFRDARGVPIFVEFAKTIRQGREGYVRYVWQWKDNPNRLAPKESYIKEFAPWGWIIGTGMYTEDVKQEIKRIEKRLARTSLAISVIMAALLLFVLGASWRSEQERSRAEAELQASSERYRSLVEATPEGMLLIIGGRCRYANPIFLALLGGSQRELELLDLSDLFPEIPDNEKAWEHLRSLLQGQETPEGFEGTLRRRNRVLVECVINASRINFAGQAGFILLTRQIGRGSQSAGKRDTQDQNWRLLQAAAEAVPVGLFRARANSRGTLVAYSGSAARLLSRSSAAEDAPLALADSFPDPQAYEDFLLELQQAGSAERKLPVTAQDLSGRRLAIAAFLTGDEGETPRYIDGLVEDITAREKHLGELEAVLARLQTSLLFLHEPVSRIAAPALFCRPETPLPEIAARMSEAGASAALVRTEGGETAGIVTDHDIRQWVGTGAENPREPVSRIMSSPLVAIPEHAEIHEALLLMEQRGLQHLAMTDEVGRIVGVIRNQALLQFRSYVPIVLLHQVEQATTPEAVVEHCRCLPDLAKSLLDCGAHPHLITRMISSVCDAATVRFIALAEAEFGPVTTPFVWLALGSQGRQEMTLASDQDNAILYEAPPDPAELPRIEQALQQIGGFVCDWLNRAGFAFCRGEAMASNPRWRQPLAVWQQYFSEWIESAEPKPLLEFSIFFDFRPVYGPADLAHQLRRQVAASLAARPAFFPLFAQNSLLFKPPARGLGRLLAGGGGDSSLLDLKEALMPIVSFARLYALRQGAEPTHTLDRLKALEEADILPAASCLEITEAYEFIMRLRLQHQALQSAAGQTPDNAINYRKLAQLEQTLLNQSFALIAAIQKRISYDFLGGTV